MVQTQLDSPAILSLAEDERWRTAQRIVESPQFSKSPRLSRLLLYLAEQSLLNRSDLVTEQVIAVRVFERDSSFNPAVDTIVRSHMVRLRQKLERYAGEESTDSAIRVGIPKGEYVVRFEKSMPVHTQESQHPKLPTENPSHSLKQLVIINWLLAVLVLISVAVILRLWHHPPDKVAASVQDSHPLWGRLFQPHQPTTFVAADSGLVLLHRMTARSTTLAEYLARDFSQETRGLSGPRAAEVLDMADRRYTSFVDLNLFRGIEHLPAASAGVELKYARDLHMDDLKRGNFIFSARVAPTPG